jgi:phenylpyruvate tautomerase PptA (4-oxalocrotonate tautomerase family)
VPIIQMDLKHQLTEEQAQAIAAEAVEVVHAAIGSAKAHINVVVRTPGGTRLLEAGGVHEAAGTDT